MTTPLPLVDGDQATAARHGAYCPKMCTFACPVAAATGRDDAVPWSFHRTVADLVDGRLGAGDAAAERLTACTGCLACRVPCLFDQNVPAQVRAGRAALHAAGASPAAVAEAVARAGAGTSPYPHGPTPRVTRISRETPGTDEPDDRAAVVVLAGCREEPASVEAALRLLRAAGEYPAVVVPSGCCGALLGDLGATEEAATARERLAGELGEGRQRVLVLDPHCLGEARAAAPGAAVVHVLEELHRLHGSGRLALAGDLGTVTYHDPCLLARDAGIVEEPRALLRAAGATLVETEGHGAGTVCSGAGLGLELLDESAAEATAARRRESLAATGAPAVTACAGARARLDDGSAPVVDLLQTLAAALPEEHP